MLKLLFLLRESVPKFLEKFPQRIATPSTVNATPYARDVAKAIIRGRILPLIFQTKGEIKWIDKAKWCEFLAGATVFQDIRLWH